MATRREPIHIAVCQIGRLERLAEVRNAVTLANQTQRAYSFDFEGQSFSLGEEYRLANGGYDLDAAVMALLQTNELPRPLLFITSEPYTDRSMEQYTDLNEGFFFSELCVDEGVAVVSTHLWRQLPGNHAVQPYVLLSLACVAFDHCAHISTHDETRGCPFDYCEAPQDIDKSLEAPGLCPECLRQVDRAIRAGAATVEQAGAAQRLFNRAAGKKQAFVAMPFRDELEPAYSAVRRLLQEFNWKVIRADEMSYPRTITDAILLAIFASDLVIADVTGSNPNVFYEVGLAHALERDVILLAQQRDMPMPIDVANQRAVQYVADDEGLKKMTRELAQLVGISK